jgi:2-polyprenyl-3-methyl-5-hydroxy-6-metoxy-1,4-benzoquinol methylase
MRTADANRLLYADLAGEYDHSEHCIAQAGVRQLLDGLLDRAIAALPAERRAAPRVLDACGGTGNVSDLLARRGITTTLADVSPQMLARWRDKAAQLGVEADTVEGEIDSFLASDGREWDLIVFSSALHHLDDYVAVSTLAASRLAPGGVLVTAFDPIRTDDRLTHRLRRFDYLLHLASRPRSLAAAVARKARRRNSGGVNYGDIAEKHALEGVDDASIVAALEADGIEILEHRRYACQRYRLTERIIRATRRSTTFHLIARKPGPQATQTNPTPTTGE